MPYGCYSTNTLLIARVSASAARGAMVDVVGSYLHAKKKNGVIIEACKTSVEHPEPVFVPHRRITD